MAARYAGMRAVSILCWDDGGFRNYHLPTDTPEQLAARARAITAAEGGKAKIRVESGIRPGGRSRVNVVSDSPWEEYGTESTKRIRALGRAAREV